MDLNNYDNQNFISEWWTKTKSSLDQYRGMGLRGLFHNFASLSILQVANYILPLIILPYLVRIIGVEKFGLVVFAYAVIQYFNIITDYGFNLSATPEVSINRHNPEKISTIFNSIYLIKAVLLVCGFILLSAVVFFFNKFRADSAVYFLTYGVVLGSVLFPIWFFQGLEKMKYITIMTLIGRVTYLILLFVLVHEEADYIMVPLANSIGAIVTGLVSTVIAVRKFKIRLFIPGRGALISQFRASSQFFLSRVSISLYTFLNTLVLGFFTTNELVGYYAAAEKLFMALRTMFSPLVQVLYPYMANQANIKLFRRIFSIGLSAAMALAIIVFFFSYEIVGLIFGDGFELSGRILRLFSVVVPVTVASVMLGYPFLAALGHENYANYSIVIGSAVHICLIAMLIPIISPITVALATIVTEIVVLTIQLYGVRKHRLWQTR